jgi:probable poly-beta-1,6-N-acetyl-D-glucosamine export protein
MRSVSKAVRKELEFGQFAKAIAILAVVFLHFLSSLFSQTIYTQSDYRLVFIILNQICRFSVPLFLALSGFGLARKYQSQTLSIKGFIVDRAKKLLPAYLIWSLILAAAFKISNTWYRGGVNFWSGILFGEVDYHLYFVPLIFQLYLFFLFLPAIKSRRRLFLLLAGAGLIQAAWFSLIRWSPENGTTSLSDFLLDDQSQYRLLGNWLFYFLLGYFLARVNLIAACAGRRIRSLFGVMALGGLTWAIYDSWRLIVRTGDVIYATSFTRLPVLFYATGFIGLSLICGPSLLGPRILNWRPLRFIGQHSYLIYLSHTLILRIIKGLITGGSQPSTLTAVVILVSAGVIFSWPFSSSG